MHTAICAFDDRERAEQARDGLVRAGFARDDVHIEHARAERADANDRWDGMEREIAMDRGVLESLGHFFTSLFGRDNPSTDTYARHVEGGRYVVVVDAHDAAEADRARTLLQGMEGGDLNVVHRPGQRPLRDIVGTREEPAAGLVERSRAPYEGWVNDGAPASDRALASHRLDTRTGPDLRDPDLGEPPGLRYADKDKPNG